MGIYTSKPVTEKDSCDEEYKYLKCGSSSMQGWRRGQEDDHNVLLDYDGNCSLFAVYDGHGGHEVAEFAAMNLPDFILNNELYKKGYYKEALIQCFLEFDAHLLEPDVIALLKKMAGSKKGEVDGESTDSEDPEEIYALRRDANMPIDELLATHYPDKDKNETTSCSGSSALTTCSKHDSSSNHKETKAKNEHNSTSEDTSDSTETKTNNKSLERLAKGIDAEITNEQQPSSSKSDQDDQKTHEAQTESHVKAEHKTKVNNDECKSPIKEVSTNGSIDVDTKNLDSVSINTEECTKNKGDGPYSNDDRNSKNVSTNGDRSSSFSDTDKQLVVQGRRIVPTLISSTASCKDKDLETGDGKRPAYTGKGKSGGKGGKVKGASAITTTTLAAEEEDEEEEDDDEEQNSERDSKTRGARARSRRDSLDDAKRQVLSLEDMDSEDDEDEEDATFALDGTADQATDDDSDDEDEEAPDDDLECDEDDEDENEDEEDVEGRHLGITPEDCEIYNEFYANMREGPGFDSGCTACVALLHESQLFVANVGDSRCVVSRGGVALDMSVDHKPEDDIETDRITKAGGKITEEGRVNGGLNLSRAFGDHGYKQNTNITAAEQMISPMPDVQTLQLTQEDDFVIIACDGIWNSLSSQQAVDFVNQQLKLTPDVPLSTICEQMFEECLAPNVFGDGTGCDNMTCIIFSFKDKSSLPPASKTSTLSITTAVNEDSATKVKQNGVSSSDNSSEESEVHNNGVLATKQSDDENAESAVDSTTSVKCKRAADDDDDTTAVVDDRPNKKPKLEDVQSTL
uniref:protein-serine/threonine phosphatase n=2 Tax=Hirondellea gigas TaxID=1518452 RepID=A0A6A7FYF4_9CRUS